MHSSVTRLGQIAAVVLVGILAPVSCSDSPHEPIRAHSSPHGLSTEMTVVGLVTSTLTARTANGILTTKNTDQLAMTVAPS
jgi:hypothetical protein